MSDLMDLDPDVRAKALARLGMTEAEYQENQARRRAAVEQGQKAGPTMDQEAVPDKFKDIPAGVVGD